MIRSRFSYLVSRIHYSACKSKQKQANKQKVFLSWLITEALCSLPFSSYVLVISFHFVFCFYSSDCFFFWNFFQVVYSFFIFSFSVVAATDIRVGHVRLLLIHATYCTALGHNNCEVGQEPITRSEQLPCARATAFSRTSLFLERFLPRILNIFQISETSQQNLQT